MLITILIGALVWAYFFKENPAIPVHERIIDSLKIDNKILRKELAQALDSSNIYRIMADTWFKIADGHEHDRVIVRTIYAQDTTRNRNLTVLQRDSIIRAIFLKR